MDSREKEMDSVRSHRKRRGTISNAPPTASSNNRAARESIIPSMSSSAHRKGSTTVDSHQHDKVGKLLKRYSTARFPSTGFGGSMGKKKGDNEKSRNDYSIPEDVPLILETSYSSITARQRQDPRAPAPHPPTKQPTLPSVPSQTAKTVPVLDRAPSLQSIPGLDENNYTVAVKDFQDASFDPQKYVQSHLADSADYQLRDYLENLKRTDGQIIKDMQRNLFNSYSQFVQISSEITTLEQEIRDTRNMMNELSIMVTVMNSKDKDSNPNGTKDGSNADYVDLPLLRREAARRADGSWISNSDSITSNPLLPSTSNAESVHRDILRSLSSASTNAKNGILVDPSKGQAIIDDQLTELDGMIAHRNIEDAVTLIEKLKVSVDKGDIDYELQDRIDQIYDILSYDLRSEFTGRKRLVYIIRILIRLGLERDARVAFLHARSKIIQTRIGELHKNPDDIPFYITQLATITFTLTRATIEIYQECFKAYHMSSSLVDWVRKQVEGYASLFSLTMEPFDFQSEQFIRSAAATKAQADQLVQIGMTMNHILKNVVEHRTALVQTVGTASKSTTISTSTPLKY
ncbi:Cullin repeat-like-containing domain protein [Lipomyces arxii]|uniref:Cullin repeat-like-containing domain protein n=1 Tax=Lipomyces arxii TaxID=56418 RepID=UPI0034CE2A42